VLASAQDLDDVLNRVIAAAAAARPFGGVLTVSSGWLDVIGSDREAGLAPRAYVGLTFAGNTEARDADLALIGSVAAIVRRLHGLVMLDAAPQECSRIHVCLPIVKTPHGGAA
jgi:hypothetical protein